MFSARLGFLAVALLLALGLARPALAATREALVIGEAAYPSTVGPLSNPGKDSALIARTLQAAGFRVQLVQNQNRLQLLREVTEYASRLQADGPGAVGFLYYSGHGVANPQDGRNYLIPVDVESTSSITLWDESVALEELIRRLTLTAPQADQVVVFDACREALRLPMKGAAKGLRREADVGGVLIAFSTSPEATASDGEAGDASGPYAAALAQALARGGRDAVTMFEQVKYGVRDRTHDTQLPWTSNGLTHPLYLNGGDSATAGPGGMTPPPVVAQSVDPKTVELTFWDSIKDSADPGLLRDYLERVQRGEFPGTFKAIAESRRASQTQSRPTSTATTPAAAALAPPLSATNADEAYSRARQLLLEGQYAPAGKAFQDFVETYGDSVNAAEARYWLGECLYIQGLYPDAAMAYIGSLRGWPQTRWAPDSTVKLARTLIALNKTADACRTLEELNRRYPGASLLTKTRAAEARSTAQCPS